MNIDAIEQPKTTLANPGVKNFLGFIISIFLTLSTYFIVTNHFLIGSTIIFMLLFFGLVQLFVQMYFFLDLGAKSEPRWNLYSFFFMFFILLILVGGSLWIMNNLNYRMTPKQIDQYMKSQSGI
jgi:cytochrome o ubiquinol oxidase operon protein cyoD